ncbi:unnamed protein product, partial [Ectocarpus sp. 8 AP-2014]
MPLLEDLVSCTSVGGALFGFSLRKIMELFASVACHDHMRVHPDGRRTNKTQLRLLETPFISRHGLSPTQYDFLVGLYEGSELEGFGVGIDETLTVDASTDATPSLVGGYFACVFCPTCCGPSMKVSELDAVAHMIGKSFAAKHVTKRCVGDCKSVFYLNKRTHHEDLGEDGLATHTFYP